jgi:hypothetical protein
MQARFRPGPDADSFGSNPLNLYLQTTNGRGILAESESMFPEENPPGGFSLKKKLS